MSRRVVSTSIFIACALLLLANGQPALANANANPGVASINSAPQDMTLGEWNARWWQWFFSVPASKNPGLKPSGRVDCSVGQSGDVWFLAGQFQASGSFKHSCTIPTGKALVIPLINSWADNVCNIPPLTVGQLRDLAKSFVIPVSELHAIIDGTPLSNLESNRAVSPVFSYTLPPSPDNVLFKVFKVKLPGPCWDSLTVTPAVADGFYIMLTPLTPGTHIINFGGSSSSGSSIDVTYNLTVK